MGIFKFFENIKISGRIVLALVLPVACLLVFSGIMVVEKQRVASEMTKLNRLAAFAPTISALAHELQKERGASAGYLVSDGLIFVARVAKQRLATNIKRLDFDAMRLEFAAKMEKFNIKNSNRALAIKIEDAKAVMAMLNTKRLEIDQLKLTVPQMAEYYTSAIAKFLAIIEELALISTNQEVSNAITAYTHFLHGKERTGSERATGSAGFSAGQFTPEIYRQFLQFIAMQKVFYELFDVYATPEQRAFYKAAIQGPDIDEAQRMREIAIASMETGTTGNIKGAKWFDAMTTKIDLLKKVEDKIAADLMAKTREIKRNAEGEFLMVAFAVFVLLVCLAFMVVNIVNSITKPLGRMINDIKRLADGETQIEIINTSRQDEIGDMIRAMEVFKKNAIDLITARNEAIKATQAKSDFLATMSHEIRTPITGVLGAADLLLDSPMTDEQKRHVSTIKTSIEALLTIVNDILDMSKLEARKLKIDNIDFHLPSLIEEVTALLGNSAKEKGLELTYSISDELPRGINGDPVRLRQILLNLAGNSIKFTDSGKVRIDAALLSAGKDQMLAQFEVIDTGIGISKAAQDRLFAKFEQADDTITRNYGGSGLGLSICKNLVEMMGGDIGVISNEGQGSTFWFTINCKPAIGNIDEKMAGTLASSFTASRQLNILLADDNKVNQKLISTILMRLGHLVFIVGDGVAAVDAVKNGDFDIVLMDIRMPNMGGVDAAREIRKLKNGKANTPIVAVTAESLSDYHEEYIAAGMNSVAYKPIKLDQLLGEIDKTMAEKIHVSTGVKAKDWQEPALAKQDAAAKDAPKTTSDQDIDNLLNRMKAIANNQEAKKTC